MKYLLDTHTFLWWNSASAKLSESAFQIISDDTNIVFISVVNVWEIQIKIQLGKLTLPTELKTIVETHLYEHDFQLLQIELPHIYGLAALPEHHRDPFDRLLIAQARHEQIPIITTDPKISLYEIEVIW